MHSLWELYSILMYVCTANVMHVKLVNPLESNIYIYFLVSMIIDLIDIHVLTSESLNLD